MTWLSFLKTLFIMNVNQQVQWDSQYLSNEAASEQSGEGNTKGANVTSTHGTITEGLIFDPNQADSSSDTPASDGDEDALLLPSLAGVSLELSA
jgi:hypothetical protein